MPQQSGQSSIEAGWKLGRQPCRSNPVKAALRLAGDMGAQSLLDLSRIQERLEAKSLQDLSSRLERLEAMPQQQSISSIEAESLRDLSSRLERLEALGVEEVASKADAESELRSLNSRRGVRWCADLRP
eukprot:Skav210746  [mRNA]  locus=scaffold2652:390162:397872:+ [translate_table: standard]